MEEVAEITGGNAFSRVFAAGAVDAIVGKPVGKAPKFRKRPTWPMQKLSSDRPGVIDDYP